MQFTVHNEHLIFSLDLCNKLEFINNLNEFKNHNIVSYILCSVIFRQILVPYIVISMTNKTRKFRNSLHAYIDKLLYVMPYIVFVLYVYTLYIYICV